MEELKNINVLYPEKTDYLSKKIKYVEGLVENKISYSDNDYILAFIYDEKKMHELLSGYGFVQEPYEKNTYLLVKYGLGSRVKAEEFVDLIIQNKKILSNDKYFVLSTSQYINMLIFKTLEINKN